MQNHLNSNMQRPKGQGWAAFTCKQQGKQGTGTGCNVDRYPSISEVASSGSAKRWINDRCGSTRSFSSVVRPSVGFPLSVSHESLVTNDDNTGTKHHIDQNTRDYDARPVKMLKDVHMWADQTLIQDVLAAVNNDIGQASVLLRAMVSSESKSEYPRPSGPCSSTVSCACDSKKKCSVESNSVGNRLSEGDHEVVMPKSLFHLPVEPEWEEDDIYLSHRKDAVRMMRYVYAYANYCIWLLEHIIVSDRFTQPGVGGSGNSRCNSCMIYSSKNLLDVHVLKS